MQIKYNVTGDRRKALVAVMRDTLQDATRYLGAPSFAFQVGKYIVDKNGTVICPDDADEAQVAMLIRELAHDGFIGERIGEPAKPAEQQIIETPRKGIMASTLDNLDRLSVEIPKGDGRTRPLGIPTVKDRIVQQAVRLVIEPIYESAFCDGSYGFRPGRGCRDALRAVDRLLKEGCTHVVDADFKSYFDTIPHARLLARVGERISDGRVLDLVGGWLEADILEGLERWTPVTGTPQGAVISPLLANIYLDPLDRLIADTVRWLRHERLVGNA